jgi:hypothetical protein
MSACTREGIEEFQTAKESLSKFVYGAPTAVVETDKNEEKCC